MKLVMILLIRWVALSTSIASYIVSSKESDEQKSQKRIELLRSILQSHAHLISHENKLNGDKLDDRLWGLVLLVFFQNSRVLTEYEIRLYILRQQKTVKRDRSKSGAKRADDRACDLMNNLWRCFNDWLETTEGKTLQSKKGVLSSEEKAKKVPQRGVIMELKTRKDLSEEKLYLLVKYNDKFQNHTGRYSADVSITLTVVC